MKTARFIILLVAALAGMLYALIYLQNPQKDPGSLSVILTISSALFSWVISEHFANFQSERENRKLIDGIGEKSSEKILNQSKQIWEIERFSKRHADETEDYHAMQALLSLRDMLRLIRSSNNTYLGDWEGVVSPPVREIMKQKISEQDRRFRELEDDVQQGSEQSIGQESALPAYLAPQAFHAPQKAVDVLEQKTNTNTTRKSQGIIRARLNRPGYKFNFTGKLYPEIRSVPADCRARILDGPDQRPLKVGVTAATGTTYDFHVHAKSYESNVMFPEGEYVFQYIVQEEDPNIQDFETDGEDGTLSIHNAQQARAEEPRASRVLDSSEEGQDERHRDGLPPASSA